MKNETQKIVEKIREMENGFCNPGKFKFAEDLREDLRDRGYSDREIKQMVNDD